MSWELLYVIPNINIRESFDGEYLSIVPYKDSRLQRIIAANSTAAALLNGFRSEAGTRIRPSAMIYREDAPKSVMTQNAVVDFRNIYAISCLVRGNSRAITSANITEPIFSGLFSKVSG